MGNNTTYFEYLSSKGYNASLRIDPLGFGSRAGISYKPKDVSVSNVPKITAPVSGPANSPTAEALQPTSPTPTWSTSWDGKSNDPNDWVYEDIDGGMVVFNPAAPKPEIKTKLDEYNLADSIAAQKINNPIQIALKDSTIKAYSDLVSKFEIQESLLAENEVQPEQYDQIKKEKKYHGDSNLFEYLAKVNSKDYEGPIKDLIDGKRFRNALPDARIPLTKVSTYVEDKWDEFAKEFEKKALDPNSVITEHMKAMAAVEFSNKLSAELLSRRYVDAVQHTIIDPFGNPVQIEVTRKNNDLAGLFLSNIDFPDAFFKFVQDPKANSDQDNPIDNLWTPDMLKDMAKDASKQLGIPVNNDMIRSFLVNNPAGRLFLEYDKATRNSLTERARELEKRLQEFHNRTKKTFQPQSPRAFSTEHKGAAGPNLWSLKEAERDYQLEALRSAVDNLTKNRKGEGKWLESAGAGFVEDIDEKIPGSVTYGLTDIAKNAQTMSTLRKVVSLIEKYGESYVDQNLEALLGEKDRLIFENFTTIAAIEQYSRSDISGGYGAGSALSEGLLYTMEFVLGGGLVRGASKAVISSMSKISARATQKILATTFGKGFAALGSAEGFRAAGAWGTRLGGQYLGGKFGRYAGGQLGKLVYTAGGATARSFVTPRMYTDMYMDTVNSQNYAVSPFDDFSGVKGAKSIETHSFISRLPSSFYANAVEAFTEQFTMTGAVLGAAFLPIKSTKAFARMLDTKWYRGYNDFMGWTKKSTLGKQVDGIWNGIIIEPLEELEGALLMGEIGDFFKKENLTNLFVSTMGVSLILGTPGTFNMMRHKHKVRTKNRADYDYFANLGIEKETLDGLKDIIDTQRNYFKGSAIEYFVGAIAGQIEDKAVMQEAVNRAASFVLRNTVNSSVHQIYDPDAKRAKAAARIYIKRAMGRSIGENVMSLSPDGSHILRISIKNSEGRDVSLYVTDGAKVVKGDSANGVKDGVAFTGKDVVTQSAKGDVSMFSVADIEAMGEVEVLTITDLYNSRIDAIIDSFFDNISEINSDFIERRIEKINARKAIEEAAKHRIARLKVRSKNKKEGSTTKAAPNNLHVQRGPDGLKLMLGDDVNEDTFGEMSDSELEAAFGNLDDISQEELDAMSVVTSEPGVDTSEQAEKARIAFELEDDAHFDSLSEAEKEVYIDSVYRARKKDAEKKPVEESAKFSYDISATKSGTAILKTGFANQEFLIMPSNLVPKFRIEMGSTAQRAVEVKSIRGLRMARTLFVKHGSEINDLIEEGALDGATPSVHVSKVGAEYEIGVSIDLGTGKKFNAQLATPAKMDELLKKRVIDKIEYNTWLTLRNYIISAYEDGRAIDLSVQVGIPKMNTYRDRFGNRKFNSFMSTNVSKYMDTQTLMYEGALYAYNRESGMFELTEFLNHVGSRHGMSLRLNAPVVNDKTRFTRVFGPVINEAFAGMLYNMALNPTMTVKESIDKSLIPNDFSGTSLFLEAISNSEMTNAEFMSIFMTPALTDKASLKIHGSTVSYGSESYEIGALTQEGFTSFVSGKTISINPEFMFNNASMKSAYALNIKDPSIRPVYAGLIDLNSDFIDLYTNAFSYVNLEANAFSPEYLFLVPETSKRFEKSTESFSEEAIQEAEATDVDNGLKLKIDDSDSSKLSKAVNKAIGNFKKTGKFSLTNFARKLANKIAMEGIAKIAASVFGAEVVTDQELYDAALARVKESGRLAKKLSNPNKDSDSPINAFVLTEKGKTTIYVSKDSLIARTHELVHLILSTVRDLVGAEAFNKALSDFSSKVKTDPKYRRYNKSEINEEKFCDMIGENVDMFINEASSLRVLGMLAKAFVNSISGLNQDVPFSAYMIFAKDILGTQLKDTPFIDIIMGNQDLTIKEKSTLLNSIAGMYSIVKKELKVFGNAGAVSQYSEDKYNRLKERFPDMPTDVLMLKSSTAFDKKAYMTDDDGELSVFTISEIAGSNAVVLSTDNNTPGVRAIVLRGVSWNSSSIVDLGAVSNANEASILMNSMGLSDDTLFRFSVAGKKHMMSRNNSYIKPMSFSNFPMNGMFKSNGEAQLNSMARSLYGAGASNSLIMALTGRTAFLTPKHELRIVKPTSIIGKVHYSKVKEMLSSWPTITNVKLSDLYGGNGSYVYNVLKDYDVEFRVSETESNISYEIYGGKIFMVVPAAASRADIISTFSDLTTLITSTYANMIPVSAGSPSQFVFASRSVSGNQNLSEDLSKRFSEASNLYKASYRSSMTESEVKAIRERVFRKTGWVMVNATTGFFSSSVIMDSVYSYVTTLKNSIKEGGMVGINYNDFVSSVPAMSSIFGMSPSNTLNNLEIVFMNKPSTKDKGLYDVSNNRIVLNIAHFNNIDAAATLMEELNHAVNTSVLSHSVGSVDINSRNNLSHMQDVLRDPNVSLDEKAEIILSSNLANTLKVAEMNEVYESMADLIGEISEIVYGKNIDELRSMAGKSIPDAELVQYLVGKAVSKNINNSKHFHKDKSGYMQAVLSAVSHYVKDGGSNEAMSNAYQNQLIEFAARGPYYSMDHNSNMIGLFAGMRTNDLSDAVEMSINEMALVDPSAAAELSGFLETRKRDLMLSMSDDVDPDIDNELDTPDAGREKKSITFADMAEMVDGQISAFALITDDIKDLAWRCDQYTTLLNDEYFLSDGDFEIQTYVSFRLRSMINAAAKGITGYKEIFNFIPYFGIDGTPKSMSKKVLRSSIRSIASETKNFTEFVNKIKADAGTNHILSAIVEFEHAAKMLGVTNYFERLYSAYNKVTASYSDATAFDLTENRKLVLMKQLMHSIKTRMHNMKNVPSINAEGDIETRLVLSADQTASGKEKRKEVTTNLYPTIKNNILKMKNYIIDLYRIKNDTSKIEEVAMSNDIDFYYKYLDSVWTPSEFAGRYISFKTFEMLNYICNMTGTAFSEDTMMLWMFSPEFAGHINNSADLSDFIDSIISDLDPINIASINEYSQIGSFILELEKINNRTQDITVKSIDGEAHSGVINFNGFTIAIDAIAKMSDDEFRSFVASNPYKTSGADGAPSSLISAIRKGGVSVKKNLKLNLGEDSPGSLMATDVFHLAKGFIPLGKIAAMGVRYYIDAPGVLPISMKEDGTIFVENFDKFARELNDRFSGYALSEINSIIKNIDIFNDRSLSSNSKSKLILGYHITESGHEGPGCYFSEYMDGLSINLDGIFGDVETDVNLSSVPLRDAIATVMSISKHSMSRAAEIVRDRIMEHGVDMNGLKKEMIMTVDKLIQMWPDEVNMVVNSGGVELINKPSKDYTDEERLAMVPAANKLGFSSIDKYIEYMESLDNSTDSVADVEYDSLQDVDDDPSNNKDGSFDSLDSLSYTETLDVLAKKGKSEALYDSKYISFLASMMLLKRLSEIETSKAIYGNPNEYGGLKGLEKRAQSFNTSFTLLAEYSESSPEFHNNTFRVLDAPDIFTHDNVVGEAGETLGAVLMSPYLYREILQRGRGWTDAMEKAFNDIMNSDITAREKMMAVSSHFNSLKLIYAGEFDFLGQGLSRIIKAQWFPMFYSKNAETDKYFERLTDPDPSKRLHAVSFQDSVKSGYAEGAIHNLSFSRLGMVSIPISHVGEKTSVLRRIITYGDPQVMNAVNNIMMKQLDKLSSEIIREDGRVNIDYLIDKLKNMSKPVELGALLSIKKLLDSDPDLDIFSISGAPSLMFDMIAKIVKDSYDIKISGSPYTSMPGVFMSTKKLHYVNENNKAEIIVPISMFKDVIKGLNYEEAVKKLTDLGYIGETSHAVMLRNPVQSEGSISNAAIVGVFPDIYGQAVAVPAGFNVASGGDNDGDKIFVYTSDLKNDPDVNMIIAKSIKDKTIESKESTDADLKAFLDADKKFSKEPLPRFINQYVSESSGLGLVGLAVALNNGHEILQRQSAEIKGAKGSFTFSNNESSADHIAKVSSAKSGLMSLAVDISKYPMLQDNNIDPFLFKSIFAYASISGNIEMVVKLMHLDMYSMPIPDVKRMIDVKYLNAREANEMVEKAWDAMENMETIDKSLFNSIMHDFAIFFNTMSSLSGLYAIAKKTNDFADVVRNDDTTFSDIVKSVISIDKRIKRNPLKVSGLRQGKGLIGLERAYNSFVNIMGSLSGGSIALHPSTIRSIAESGLRIEEFAEMTNSIGILRSYNKRDILKILNHVAKRYNLIFGFDVASMNKPLTMDGAFKMFKRSINVPYIHSVNLSNRTLMDLLNENKNDFYLAEFARIYNASAGLGPAIRKMNLISMLMGETGLEQESGEVDSGSIIPSKYIMPGAPLPAYYSVKYGVYASPESALTTEDTTMPVNQGNAIGLAMEVRDMFSRHSVLNDKGAGPSVTVKSYDGVEYTFNGTFSKDQIAKLNDIVFAIRNDLGVLSLQMNPTTIINTLSSIEPDAAITVISPTVDFAERFYNGDIKYAEKFDSSFDYESRFLIIDPAVLGSNNKLKEFYDYAERTGSIVIFQVNDTANAPSSLYTADFENTKAVYNEFGKPADINKILDDNSNRTILSSSASTAAILKSADQTKLKERFVILPGHKFAVKATAIHKARSGEFFAKVHGSEKIESLGQSPMSRNYLRINEARSSANGAVLVLVDKGADIGKIMAELSLNKKINDIRIVELSEENSSYKGLNENSDISEHCAR